MVDVFIYLLGSHTNTVILHSERFFLLIYEYTYARIAQFAFCFSYRGKCLEAKLEEMMSGGRICAIIYSSPNNPAWFNLTEDELKKMLDDIQKLTGRYIGILEKMLADKDKDLMTL